MRLLLDEMHAPAVARHLRDAGHDAVAVKERPDLVGLDDEDLLAAAAADGRALVTENVKDFALLDRRWAAAGKSHAGLVFTHPRRFPRSSRSYVPRLAGALARLIEEHGHGLRAVEAFVWWLDVRRSDR